MRPIRTLTPLNASLLPAGSGGMFPALYLWRRLAVEGFPRFGEVYYLGTAPLLNREGLVDVLVGGAGVALATQSRSRLSPLGLIGLLSFVLAFYPTLRGLFLGQYTLIVFACLSFSLVLIGRGRDGWARGAPGAGDRRG